MRKLKQTINIVLSSILSVTFLLTSCSHTTFADYNTGEVLGDHRDGYAMKIDKDYWIKKEYSDDRSQDNITLYYAPDSIKDMWIGYMLNDENNVEICSGNYEKYALNDQYIYILCSQKNLVIVINKHDKTYLVVSVYECDDNIEWMPL